MLLDQNADEICWVLSLDNEMLESQPLQDSLSQAMLMPGVEEEMLDRKWKKVGTKGLSVAMVN
jgi:hypothetical protein